jgi:hypothetical protein
MTSFTIQPAIVGVPTFLLARAERLANLSVAWQISFPLFLWAAALASVAGLFCKSGHLPSSKKRSDRLFDYSGSRTPNGQ